MVDVGRENVWDAQGHPQTGLMDPESGTLVAMGAVYANNRWTLSSRNIRRTRAEPGPFLQLERAHRIGPSYGERAPPTACGAVFAAARDAAQTFTAVSAMGTLGRS